MFGLSAVLAALAVLWCASLTTTAGAAVNGSHVIASLFRTSGLELSGYTPDKTVSVAVQRNGAPIATSSLVTNPDGTLTVNPTACWQGTTPEILPGDVVSVSGDGPTDTMVVQDVANTVARRDPASSNTILVSGTALDPVTKLPLSLATVEARIISKTGAFANGKKVLRQTSTPGVGLGTWEVRFAGLSSADQKLALAAAEVRGVYQNAAANEITISQNPAVAGPVAPCTAPLARNGVLSASRNSVNLSNVGTDLVLAGVSTDATSVSVSLDDQDPATPAALATTSPAPVSGAQTWSVTIPAANVAALRDGTLTATGTYVIGGLNQTGNTFNIAKDTVAPAAPTATPAPGAYNAAQAVTLSDADPTATLRYTNTGIDPTTVSTVAAAPISVAGTQTLKAIAVDQVGNISPVAPFAYTIDTVAPSTSLSGGPTGITSVTNASFAFSSADGTATFECRFDGSAWSACTTPQAYAGLADGAHTFAVRAVDAVGNIEATPPTRTWTVDTVAPGTGITGGPSGATRSTSASIAFASTEAGTSFECRLDSGAWAACVSPHALSGLADGAHVFDVRARDAAGNVDATPDTLSWNVDATAPDTTITAGPSGNSAADVSFEFNSNETGSSFECRLGGGPWSGCSSPQRYLNLSPGPHTFDVRASDAVGNVDATPAGQTWSVDSSVGANGNPVGLQIDGGAQFTNDPNVTVTAVPRLGAVSSVRLSNDGGFLNALTQPVVVPGQYAWALDSTGSERLPKTVYARFVGAGMDQGETFTDDIILDQTSPVVVAASLTPSSTGQVATASTSTAGLRVVARDGTSGVRSLEIATDKRHPGAWRTYKSRVKMRTTARRLYVRVRDRAGNISRWRTVRVPRSNQVTLGRSAR